MDIAIYGAGGFAREVAWLVKQIPEPERKILCFIDDDPEKQGRILNGISVFSFDQVTKKYPSAKIVTGIGSPSAREKVVKKIDRKGFEYVELIHPNVQISEWITKGIGSVICAGNILTVNVILGNHVQINLDCTIGHDVFMGDYATLAPGVHISGNVHIGKRVYIGTGANIINGTSEKPLVIEDDAIVGAGACVIRNVAEKDVVAGVPARSIRTKE